MLSELINKPFTLTPFLQIDGDGQSFTVLENPCIFIEVHLFFRNETIDVKPFWFIANVRMEVAVAERGHASFTFMITIYSIFLDY